MESTPTESLEAIGFIAPALEAPIIDVGGGSSRLAACLLDIGHTDITVLDVSQTALDLARRRLGRRAGAITWLVDDLLAWSPERAYAIWHDRALLHFFTEPAERRAYADKLRSALSPDGHAIIATFAPGGPDHCSGLPVQRSDAADVLRLIGQEFTALKSYTRTHRTPAGTAQPFTWVIAQRTVA